MRKKSLMLMYSVHLCKMLQVLSSVKCMGKGLSHLKGNSDDDKHFRH